MQSWKTLAASGLTTLGEHSTPYTVLDAVRVFICGETSSKVPYVRDLLLREVALDKRKHALLRDGERSRS